jgi:hypothetical protein
MLRKFIQVTDGRISGTCAVEMDPETQPTAGLIEVPADTDLSQAVRRTFDGDTIGDLPPVRVVGRGAFMDRFPLATQIALEAISEQQTTAGRMIRVFTRRLEAEDPVNLDSATLLQRLQQLAPVLIAAQVEGWEDADAAAATIAGILG